MTYELVKKDGGTEFSLTIEGAVAGGKFIKEMVSSQGFIASNLKVICETGKPAITGRMVGVLAPQFGLQAKDIKKIENWPLD